MLKNNKVFVREQSRDSPLRCGTQRCDLVKQGEVRVVAVMEHPVKAKLLISVML